MPRRPRVFVEGGIYHVYNRFASGEAVFTDPEEARDFVEFLRFVKKRDEWSIFAWSLMSNHYHLAIRSRAVPISHGLHYLQGRFSQQFNRSRKRTGALWQSRYQAKPINEQAYLDRVILYIHLNPVLGGLVSDPVDHVFSGHREIVKRISRPLIDIDETLLCFGQTERSARRAYLSAVRLGCREAGRNPEKETATDGIWLRRDRDLAPDDSGPYIDVLGRSTGPERPEVSAGEFVNACAAILDVGVEELASRSRRRPVAGDRRLIVTLGRERWGQSTKELASVLKKSADTVSYLTREGITLRLEDQAFARRYEGLDAEMIACGRPATEEADDP
jgi:REP element-mobilizing transposase RayT